MLAHVLHELGLDTLVLEVHLHDLLVQNPLRDVFVRLHILLLQVLDRLPVQLVVLAIAQELLQLAQCGCDIPLGLGTGQMFQRFQGFPG